MGIQQRLKQQRYGPMCLQVPTKDDLLDAGIRIHHLRNPDIDLLDRVFYQLQNPPVRDQYYLHYIRTINSYHKYMDFASKAAKEKSHAGLLNRHLVGKLLYFMLNPNLYGGSFTHYKYAWMHNILCSLRSATLKQMYNQGEIPSWRAVPMWTNGNQSFVKPMSNPAMAALADNLYDMLQPRVEYIAKLSGLKLD